MNGDFWGGVFLGVAIMSMVTVLLSSWNRSDGRDEACQTVCADGYGWWGENEKRCICAKEESES